MILLKKTSWRCILINKNSSIKDIKAYFNTLTLPQKKQFIEKLEFQLKQIKSPKYKDLLDYCVKKYNEEIKKEKTEVSQNASDELFARAIAKMLSGEDNKPTSPKLEGLWERKDGVTVYFYDFRPDGTFYTNENKGINGFYKTGIGGIILMEPIDELNIKNILVSGSGKRLFITYNNGISHEYNKSFQKQ